MVATWYSKAENIKALLKAEDINIYVKSPHGGAMAKDLIGGWDQNPDENDKRRNKELLTIFEHFESELQAKIDAQKIYNVVIDPNLSLQKKKKLKP